MLKKIKLLLFSSIVTIGAHGMDDDTKPPFSTLNKDTQSCILHHLPKTDILSFRRTSKINRNQIHQYLEDTFIRELNTFTSPLSLNLPPIQSIQKKVIEEHFKKATYLFVPQGSLLEDPLDQNYTKVYLYPYLKDHAQEWAGHLYQALFDLPIPREREKFDHALGHLTACLPITYLYISKDADPTLALNKFKENESHRLIDLLKKKRSKDFFLVGTSHKMPVSSFKDSFVIVANQSQLLELKTLEDIFFKESKHTLILNVEDKKLTLGNRDIPQFIDRLVLADSKGICKEIDNEFLAHCYNLKSIEFRSLKNITTIGDWFLGNPPFIPMANNIKKWILEKNIKNRILSPIKYDFDAQRKFHLFTQS